MKELYYDSIKIKEQANHIRSIREAMIEELRELDRQQSALLEELFA